MRVIERKIYKFNELSKEVQDKLIEKEQENVRNDYVEFCLHDDMEENAKRLLEKYFGNSANFENVYYDLSYSQGSGAIIEFSINFKDLNKKYHIVSKEEERFLTDKGVVNNIIVRHNDNFYYHEYTFGIDYNCDIDCYSYDDVKENYDIKEEDFYTLSCRIDDLIYGSGSNLNNVCKFRQDIIAMNKELANIGYKLIEHDIDISWIKENLNDYEYYKDGDIYLNEL